MPSVNTTQQGGWCNTALMSAGSERDFEVLYHEKWEKFKVAREMCLNARSGVRELASSGRRLTSRESTPFTLSAKKDHRKDLLASSVYFVLELYWQGMLMTSWSDRRSWWKPLYCVACYSRHTHGLGCTGMPRKKCVSSDTWLNKTWMRSWFLSLAIHLRFVFAQI